MKKQTRRERKAAEIQLYEKQVAKPAQKGQDPNDRRYDRNVERKLRQISPLELDALLAEDDER